MSQKIVYDGLEEVRPYFANNTRSQKLKYTTEPHYSKFLFICE